MANCDVVAVKVLRDGGLEITSWPVDLPRYADGVRLFVDDWSQALAVLDRLGAGRSALVVKVRLERLRIAGRFGHAWAHEVLAKLGVRSLPLAGMPERLIDGVRVYVKPLPPPSCAGCGGKLWMYRGKANPVAVCEGCRRPVGRVRNFQGLRVMAICECGVHVAVGRLGQHKCHSNRRRGGR